MFEIEFGVLVAVLVVDALLLVWFGARAVARRNDDR